MKKQVGRRLGVCVLSSLLMVNTTFPVCADLDTNGYTYEQLNDDVIEYDEIQYLVAHNNNTVISNNYTYRNLKEMVEESENSSSSPTGSSDGSGETEAALEIVEAQITELNKSIKELKTAIAAMTDPAQKAAAENQLQLLENTVAVLQIQQGSMTAIGEMNSGMSEMMNSMTSSAGMSDIDLRNYYLQFAQAEDTIVKTAQSMFPAYYQLMYSLKQLRANLSVAETAYEGTLVQVQYGLCSDSDVTAALYNVTSIRNNIASLENQVVSMKQEICKLIGKDYNVNITLGKLPEIDYTYIAGIELNEDIERALENSYAIRSKENTMRGYNDDTANATKKADSYSLMAAREDTRSAVKSAYLAVQSAMAEVEMAQKQLLNEESMMVLAEEKFDMGLISLMEYEQQRAKYAGQECAYKTAESKLLDAVNSYKWSVWGL